MNKKSPIVITIIAIFALSSICLLDVSAQVTNQPASTTNPNPLTGQSYTRIIGAISMWGTTPVNGMLQSQARIGTFESGDTRQFATATAIWTTNKVRPIATALLKEDFTYVFYQARLVNPAVSELVTGSKTEDYVLSGTWNLWTVTTSATFTKNDQGQVTGVHRTMDKTVERVQGELRVTDSWSKFTLTLTGIDPLTGTVARSVLRQLAFNPFKVTEDITSNIVTKADVAAVIRAFGAMPGNGNYNPIMDFQGHFKVDITSLSTVASNM